MSENKYRVSRRRSVNGPDHWGVQRLDGYTDGRPSWVLATLQRFWSATAAAKWILDKESTEPRPSSGADQ